MQLPDGADHARRVIPPAPAPQSNDEARENETLTVPAGQILHIAGSGLKSSSTVTLEDGATIVFHKTATISAPVTLAGAATIRTIDANAEGTKLKSYERVSGLKGWLVIGYSYSF